MGEYADLAIEEMIWEEPEGCPGEEPMFTDDQFFEFYEHNAIWLPGNVAEIHDVIIIWMEFLRDSNDRTTNSLPHSFS